ncbi:MAG: helix-turn-helix transcriptional regulator [Muribaculaceae bacterium]|nr:helix-turn-helix transcriptional regulator [Muribaculaceae bacterium]
MDIVSRLKKFMEFEKVASTQFADRCGIPRPTVSQILNGRNKKISDELIGKIHAAFPSLSVLWLMFGEGDMNVASNNEISEPQNHEKFGFSETQDPEHMIFSADQIEFNADQKNESDNFGGLFSENFSANQPKNASEKNIIKKISETSSDCYKKITSIVVFYDDSTFQTFNPSAL